MKLKRILRTIIAAELVIIAVLGPATPAARGLEGAFLYASPDGIAQVKGKDEVIYGTLGADGSVSSVYAVNYFSVAKSGSITDHGAYSSVANLTDTAPLTQEGDAVTVQANTENFYYQGNMDSTDLPWLFEIAYFLEGAAIEPQALAGKDGHLEIRIKSRQNPAIDPVFYENYMLQITVTLDTEKCADIEAADATVANAGKNKVAAFTVLPGKDADVSLTALVRDFTMAGIDITAIPFSMNVELPDTDGMMDDFTHLSDAISELNDGVGELRDGASELKSGASKLTGGSAEIQEGLALLSGNSGVLLDGSAQISNALAIIASSVSGAAGGVDLGDMAQLPAGLTQLSDGLDGVITGLTELKNGFAPSYAALDAAIQGIPAASITQEQIQTLYGMTDASQHGLLDSLVAQYTAGQTVKGTYNTVKAGFDAVAPTIDTLNGHLATASATLTGMAGQISASLSGMDIAGQLGQLSSGLWELSGKYGEFHSKLAEYLGGIDTLSAKYGEFHGGLASFGSGMGALSRGVGKLHDGTTELSDETADMPDTVQQEIDDLMNEYTASDFEPVSFTSPQNKTDLVQFVLKCGGIEKPEEVKANDDGAGKETLWNRVVALFT